MTKRLPDVRCKVCLRWHAATHMCGPARRILNALAEQGMKFDMPTLEFPEPIPHTLSSDDVTMAQLVVKAGVIAVGSGDEGTHVGALVFTGVDSRKRPLPQWVLPADDEQLDAVCALVSDMAELAKRRAELARGE